MKKIIMVIIAIMLIFCFTSCEKYEFRRVHIFIHNGQDKCLEIQGCITYPAGADVHTREYGTLYLSEGTYMLCELKCPICGR